MFSFEKKANMKNGKTQEQIHVESFFQKFGQESGADALEIDERIKHKSKKPVFKHISEFFDGWCDDRGAFFTLLADSGQFCFFIWETASRQDVNIYYVCKSEFDLPDGAWDGLYRGLGGCDFLIRDLKNGKYAIIIDKEEISKNAIDFVNRFPEVEKKSKQKAVIKKDDDEKNHDASYRQFFTPSI